MTQTRDTSASPPSNTLTTLPADGFTGRALRARTDPMVVRPLRDDRYVVETERGTYVVDLDGRSCTCPDHAIRGARCKHLRRVAIEVNEGRVPPPGKRTAVCAVCGDQTFVPTHERGPQLCSEHSFTSGEFVRDRETGSVLVVIDVTTDRADEHVTADGRTIADYESNAGYGGHEPVVEVAYLESLRRTDDVHFSDARQYGFPASRLRRLGRRQSRMTTFTDDGGDAGTSAEA